AVNRSTADSATTDLQLSDTQSNRKLVLKSSANNDMQYFGWGYTNAWTFNTYFQLINQIATSADSFAWNSATSSTAFNRCAELTGTGVFLIYGSSNQLVLGSSGSTQHIFNSTGFSANATLTLPLTSTQLVGTTDVATLTNKSFSDSVSFTKS